MCVSKNKKSFKKLFIQPLFPKIITNETTTNIDGKTNGINERALTSFFPGNSLLAIKNAAGTPIKTANKVEIDAW